MSVGRNLLTETLIDLNQVVALIDSALGVLNTRHMRCELTGLVARIIIGGRLLLVLLVLKHSLMLVRSLCEWTRESRVRGWNRALKMYLR